MTPSSETTGKMPRYHVRFRGKKSHTRLTSILVVTRWPSTVYVAGADLSLATTHVLMHFRPPGISSSNSDLDCLGVGHLESCACPEVPLNDDPPTTDVESCKKWRHLAPRTSWRGVSRKTVAVVTHPVLASVSQTEGASRHAQSS